MSWPGRPPARTGARPRWTPARRAAVLPELRRAIPGQEVAALLTRAETRARDLLTSHRQALAQRHHRHHARPRHEIGVIKRCVDLRQAMQQSHLRGVLSVSDLEASATPIV